MRKYVIKPRIVKMTRNTWTWVWWDHQRNKSSDSPKMDVTVRRRMVYYANHFVGTLNAKQERLV